MTDEQEAMMRDIRRKYADDPEVIHDFEVVLGIAEPEGL